MDFTKYCRAGSESKPFRSERWVHAFKWSFVIASSQSCLAPCLSSDTLTTVNPLSLYLLNIFTTLGFSFLQGTHQLAQKSRNTYLPLNPERLTNFPEVSGKVKSS